MNKYKVEVEISFSDIVDADTVEQAEDIATEVAWELLKSDFTDEDLKDFDFEIIAFAEDMEEIKV